MTGKHIAIVEVPPFERLAATAMSDHELDEFKSFLALNPEVGVLIRGTGGIRKVRWATGGKGKSGGVRVIYYYHNDDIPLFLLAAYAKSHKESLTMAETTALRNLARSIVQQYQERPRR